MIPKIILIQFLFFTNTFCESSLKLIDTCKTQQDIKSNYNKFVYIIGKLTLYNPPIDSSKLGNENIWQWILITQDEFKFPVVPVNLNLDLNQFVEKQVLVKAFIYHGIIFGFENTANIEGIKLEIYDISYYVIDKIKFDLNKFSDNGLIKEFVGEFRAINYEFCIPADSLIFYEVKSIDPSVNLYKFSKGRSECQDNQWLCIGYSYQQNFIDVIKKLAELSYIEKISETFWE